MHAQHGECNMHVDACYDMQHIEGTAAAFAWLEERGYLSVGTVSTE